jgi:hypothetical protein
MVRWNRQESFLEFSLIELLGKSPTEGRSLVLFTHMSFPQKLDIMGALVAECLFSPAYQWLSGYREVERLLKDAQQKRNAIAHGKWGVDASGGVGKSRITAHGALKISSGSVAITEIEEASEVIVKAADALAKLVFPHIAASDAPQSGQ